MLTRMRKGVKSLTAKVLMVLLVASFAVWGIGDIFSFRLDARVAKVGDTEVSAERFANALTRQQSRLSREYGRAVSLEELRQSGIAGSVLSGLVRDAAFEEEMGALGLSAPDAAVADAIREHPAFQGPGGQFSGQFYLLSLQQQGMTASEFEALTRTLLAQDILLETARAGAVPPPGVAERIATYRGEMRGVNLLRLGLDMAPEPGEPGADGLRAFYDANQAMFTEPERRWGEYLHVDADRLLEELTPDEAALRAAYEEFRPLYTVEERRTVDQITYPDRDAAEAAAGRLLAGDASFETLAGERGLAAGDMALGEVDRDDLPAAAAGLVFGESEPGIVGPVELPAGFALYRVREITPGGTQPFEEVRDRIAEQLARDALLSRAAEIANEIEELRAGGLTMQEIAERTGARHGSFEGLARDGSLAGGGETEGLLSRRAFIQEVFEALDVEERDLVETDDGGYFVVMVRRIEPSEVKPLAEVRERAVAAWREAERVTALEEKAAQIAGRLGVEASIWDAGAELGVPVLPLTPFTRLDAPDALPPALVDKVFRAGSGEGVFAPAADGSGVVVAQVASIALPAPERIESESARIGDVLANSLQSDLGEFFARAVVARHEPRIEPGVVEEVFTQLGGGARQAGQ
ncbi:MAG TPA: SurA N-terminal domain-containing protein [Thermohalobaculum sp.]|nr:SurA N-terminal domain-containing protein [Thermohalobaculum sp.]